MNSTATRTCGALLALAGIAILPACHRQAEAPVAGPVRVVAVAVAAADTGREFAYSGTIVASETLPQSFAVTGTATRVAVNEGDVVAKGQVLAEIDDTTYRRTLEMSRATEKQAEDAYARLSKMYRNGNLAEIKYIEVETGLYKARAAAAIAGKNLDDCRLRASASGYVGKRAIEPGMVVVPHVDQITIVRIDPVYASIPVPENDVARLRKGDPAMVRIGALDNTAFAGTVEDIGVMADPLAHSYTARIVIANSRRLIRPGMVCTATLRGQEKSRGLVIPNRAVLVDENGRNYVYSLDRQRSRASVRTIQLGELLENGIRVVAGLSENDLVVVSGQHKLVDGAAVQVIEP